MKNNRLIFVAFILLFLSSLYLLYKSIFDNDNDVKISLIDDETAINYMSSYMDLMFNNGLKADMYLFDVHDSSMLLTEDLFKNNDSAVYLVCRVHEEDCSECTNYAMARFHEFDSIIINTRLKPIIVGTYDSYTSLSIMASSKIDCYYTPSLDIPMDERGYPYYFVIDSSRRIFDLFAPNISYSQLIDAYFEIIRHKWSGI